MASTAVLPIANARMYSATPRVRADWKALLGWVLARAGLDWPVIDYDAPAPLDALWARGDLGLAMMCGLPFSLRVPPAQLIAAPCPSPARYQGRPIYFTDLVVRADSPHRTIADTFGGRIGYTLADSLSGGVAPRVHLAPWHRAHGRLYRSVVGQLINARGVIDALVRGDVDVGPLDSYYHDLLRHDDPAFAASVRTVASTEARPIPPLVATAALDADTLAALRAALRDAGTEPALADLRRRLKLGGFAFPAAADYAPLAGLVDTDLPEFEDL